MFEYYDILGVNKDSSQEDIKKAYRAKAKEYHPDINKDSESESNFKKISEAYEILSDPDKRKHYDMFGESKKNNNFSNVYENWNNDFNSFFSSFFNNSNFSREKNTGADAKVNVQLTLEECFQGVEKEIRFNSNDNCKECAGKGCKKGSIKNNCTACKGMGRVTKKYSNNSSRQIHIEQTCAKCNGAGKTYASEDICSSCKGSGLIDIIQKIRFKVPQGISNGLVMVVKGNGLLRSSNGQRGNLMICFLFKEHSIFQVDGINIHMKYHITLSQAIFGDIIEIPTLHGPKTISISKGTQNDTVLKIKKLGLSSQSGNFGDLIITFKIEIPNLKEDSNIKNMLKNIENKETLPVTFSNKDIVNKYLTENKNA